MEQIYISRVQNEGLKYLDQFEEFELVCNSYDQKEFSHYNELILKKGYTIISNKDIGRDFEAKIVHYKKENPWDDPKNQLTFIINTINDGYSIIRFNGDKELNEGYEYGACDSPLHFDYTHNGTWGSGKTPFEALFNCYTLKQFKNTQK